MPAHTANATRAEIILDARRLMKSRTRARATSDEPIPRTLKSMLQTPKSSPFIYEQSVAKCQRTFSARARQCPSGEFRQMRSGIYQTQKYVSPIVKHAAFAFPLLDPRHSRVAVTSRAHASAVAQNVANSIRVPRVLCAQRAHDVSALKVSDVPRVRDVRYERALRTFVPSRPSGNQIDPCRFQFDTRDEVAIKLKRGNGVSS